MPARPTRASPTPRPPPWSTPGSPAPGVVSPNQLLIWGAKTGARKRIEDGKAGPAELAALCLAITDMLGSGSIGLDTANGDNRDMLAKLVDADICSQGDADALVVMGFRPGPSRASVLGFPLGVTAFDLAAARSR